MFNSVYVAHDISIHQVQDFGSLIPVGRRSSISMDQPAEKTKRNPQGNPDLNVEVVALSAESLTATHGFYCEICDKGFTRDQNLQLHKRSHNLPWKLKQAKNGKQTKRKKYVCPEPTCIRHNPLKALGDLTGIKKHYLRKHYVGDKKWKCEKCQKCYAVEGDWKAHSKTCCTKEHQCDSGTISSRKESLLPHMIHCDSIGEEHAENFAPQNPTISTETILHFNPPPPPPPPPVSFFPFPSSQNHFPDTWDLLPQYTNSRPQIHMNNYEEPNPDNFMTSSLFTNSQYASTTIFPSLSTTTLFQQGATVGAIDQTNSTIFDMHTTTSADPFTQDFLGMMNHCGSGEIDRDEGSSNAEGMFYYGNANYQVHDRSDLFPIQQGFADQSIAYTWHNYD